MLDCCIVLEIVN